MAKTYYCAGCGLELLVHRKAYPNQEKIINVVEPHECSESAIRGNIVIEAPAKNKLPSKLDEIFDSFKFVSKLNDLEEKTEKPKVIKEEVDEMKGSTASILRDRREDIRTSTAPQGILGAIKDMDSSPAERPIIDPESEKGGQDGE